MQSLIGKKEFKLGKHYLPGCRRSLSSAFRSWTFVVSISAKFAAAHAVFFFEGSQKLSFFPCRSVTFFELREISQKTQSMYLKDILRKKMSKRKMLERVSILFLYIYPKTVLKLIVT